MSEAKRREKAGQPRRLLCFSAAFCLPCLVFALCWRGEAALPWCWPLAAAAAAGGALWLAGRGRWRFAYLGLAAGALWSAVYLLFLIAPCQKYMGNGAEVLVEATAAPVSYTTYSTLEGRLLAVNGKSLPLKTVTLYLEDGSPEIEPGQRPRFTGVIRRGSRPENGAYLTVSQAGPMEIQQPARMGVQARMARWSAAIARQVDTLLGGDEGALLKALLCGDKSGMSRDFRSALNISGLAHIAAVSGMHLSVLAGFVIALLGRKWGSIAAIPLVLLYAGVTGCAPSVLRAAIMMLTATAGFLARREADSLTSLFLALLILTAANPCALLSPSLLLSFSATLGILLFAPMLLRALPTVRNGWYKKPLDAVVRCAVVSASATVFALPITLLFFTRVSVLSVLSSLLTLWAVSAALVLGAAVVGVSVFAPAAAGFLARWVLGPLLGYITGVTGLLGGNPALSASASSPYVVLAVLAVALAAILARWKKARAIPALAWAGAAAAVCIGLSALEGAMTTRVSILDAGGSAVVLVDTQGKSYALNCGAGSRGIRAMEDELLRLGRGGLEELIVTAPQAGNTETILAEVGAAWCAAPQESAAGRYAGRTFAQGGSRPWGAGELEIIALGGSYAARLVLPHMVILDLTQVKPVDYYTAAKGADLTGDILLVPASWLEDPPALQRAAAYAGCRAMLCSDNRFQPAAGSVGGVPLISLSAQERVEMILSNW